MKTIKVADATPLQLDWLVAKCEGRLHAWIRDPDRIGTSIEDIGLDSAGVLKVYVPGRRRELYADWAPSRDWAQGGPIIEHERLYTSPHPDGATWVASKRSAAFHHDGPTPLIAAMRCHVASKLGNDVEVPEELT